MPVPVFSVNEVLTSSAMNRVGLWKVDEVVWSTGATAQVFDGKFTNDFSHYRVIFRLQGSANNLNILGKLRANGVTTTTTTEYRWVSQTQYPGIGAVGVNGSNSFASWDLGTISQTSTTCILELQYPKAAYRTMVQYNTTDIQDQFGQSVFWVQGNGFINNTTSYDGFQISTSSNFTGSATIYGYNK